MKKKRLLMVLLILFVASLLVGLVVKITGRNISANRQVKTISIQEAKKAAQASLSSFESWREPKTQESYTFYDLEGAPSAYLFNVSDNYGKAGYITVSATTKLDPLVEISSSTETPIVKTLQLINQITEGTIYGLQDVKTQYLYLGGIEYFVKLTVREGENTQTLYYSLQNESAQEVDFEEIRSKQDIYKDYYEEGAQQKWEDLFVIDM